MHHVTVVDALRSLTAHSFGRDYQCTAITHLQMIGMNAYPRPVTDQPRGQRVRLALYPDDPQRLTVTSSSRYAASTRSTARSSTKRPTRTALRALTNASTHCQYDSTLWKSRLPRRRRHWSSAFFNPRCEDSASPFSYARPGVFRAAKTVMLRQFAIPPGQPPPPALRQFVGGRRKVVRALFLLDPA